MSSSEINDPIPNRVPFTDIRSEDFTIPFLGNSANHSGRGGGTFYQITVT